ncbi:HesA/MoeB/ThiF family protein [Sulfolobus acidocaldarius]|uniref:Dinucleotide-utilizing enzymes n=4 Tax=Sulfolobus acidocaldarius TaxID=2285 RepID=Q4JC81_SULAC|nr:HesA/MoeB/ThiF family protein [Sulfolobus acidocaldarius]AAY79598.1 dinucleotide-utilizing enzymes [Sulfolobus acidocaldarius DSM 639]AGE70152.1 dinucleotide-utilizing enzyme [Sulfolobus acidocaldarius N8]AGE72427.1 dinucleotide-utilizing enzyme [Sulfolobus acidocaldarius Ron12/I]ALU30576.1 thiamine biosynthesis protein ThiF [Sulfolobus acidocaldarius]ALU32838.1 thiamine biosynthesis protein ThiF [Sulfolobus acidocaldarius]
MERYARQLLVLGLGVQEKISQLKIAIVGCGALGTTLAELLARLGVGKIKLIDADIVEVTNLHRTHLFEESDIGKPKATVCAEKIRKINSGIKVEVVNDIIDSNNAEEMLKDSDYIFDALDNLYYRFLLNDVAVKLRIPLVYGGVMGEYSSVMLIVPREGPCLRCFMNYDEHENEVNACETIGTLDTVISITASLQVQLMLNHLRNQANLHSLYYLDTRELRIDNVKISKNDKCPTCSLERFDFLDGRMKQPSCGLSRLDIESHEFLVRDEENGNLVICYPSGKCFKKSNR